MKNLVIHNFKRIDRLMHRVIKSLENKDRIANTTSQITPNEWEQIYLSEPKPILELSSPIAIALVKLSLLSDSFIEMGCGSATISAELATEKRIVSLCDFSQPILEHAKQLFEISHLPEPETILLDISKQYPIPDKSYDIVWSSGVLEHWEDQELIPIVREMTRISRKYVVSLVPNASSLFYRIGKLIEEHRGTWIYGKEIPRESLKDVFISAGLRNVSETVIANEMAINWFRKINPELFPLIQDWWNSLGDEDVVKRGQGYLLLTIGHV